MLTTLVPFVAMASALVASAGCAKAAGANAGDAAPLPVEPPGRPAFDLPAIAAPASQEPARLVVAPPLPDFLARGLVIIQYRADNLRIVPVFGPAALEVKPRIGHIHVTIDDAPWHWADAGGEQLIIQGLPPGPHSVRIDLADPTHRVIDTATLRFEIPAREGEQR